MFTNSLILRLRKVIFTNTNQPSKYQVIFWITLSMIFSVIYAILGLQKALKGEYVVQDDARQHVFWMLRYIDGNLFPNNLIADYFQSVAPVGYSSLYRIFVFLGINPLVFNKILPLVLGLFTTGYCFGVTLQIIPLPFTGFLATLILNQQVWANDDLISATPRAFLYPLVLAFLYYLLRKSLVPTLVVLVLLGLFYPQYVFICVGILILRLWDWSGKGFRFSQRKHDYLFCAVGVGVAFLVMLPYALKTSEFGPVITVAQAKELAEFQPAGRASFFTDSLRNYFLRGRSGLNIPSVFSSPITFSAGFLLPLVMLFPSKFPYIKKINGEIATLAQMVIVSLGMFFLAHLLLFKLHLPSRYTGHGSLIILSISAAIVLTIILDTILPNFNQKITFYSKIRQLIGLVFTSFIAATLLFNYPSTGYVVGSTPALYEFFQKQPKDTLIASITGEIDNIPTFSQRSVLVAREYGIPYHFGYYSKFRQRVIDLTQAQYSQDLENVKTFIQKYGVDFWLLESGTFTPEYIENNALLRQYYVSNLIEDKLVTITKDIFQGLQQGNVPALSKIVPNCTAAKIADFVVLDTKCIVNNSNNDDEGLKSLSDG